VQAILEPGVSGTWQSGEGASRVGDGGEGQKAGGRAARRRRPPTASGRPGRGLL